MENFKLWRFGLATLVVLLIAQIVHMIDPLFAMSFYTNADFFGVWSKYMMPDAGPPPAIFYYMSVGFNLIGALIFCFVYALLKHAIPGKSLAAKGLVYGLLVFLLSSVTGMLMMILFFHLPLALILIWTAEDLVIKTVGGMTTAGISK